ncbi:hypothetical protein ACWCPT_29735 [Streptomyces sp. NPDC002308]
MTPAHQPPAARRNEEPAPQVALPKPAYRNLFLAPDLPDDPSAEDDNFPEAARR